MGIRLTPRPMVPPQALYVYGGAWRAISLAHGFFTGESTL